MRAIKFRAWDESKKQMYHNVSFIDEFGFIKYGYTATPWTDEAKAGIGMQYIGLQDKNGKNIYEGDIISIGELPEYQNIIVDDIRYITHIIDATKRRIWIQIIGNIYENKNLLGD
jgi:uncharacterized phage protein (TIGR01671 family)